MDFRDKFMNINSNSNTNIDTSTRLKFPPFLQCTRTGNGDWRCQSMVAPGRSYCERHYKEQKIRNERKRHRKLAALAHSNSKPPTGTATGCTTLRTRKPAPESGSGSGGSGSASGARNTMTVSRIDEIGIKGNPKRGRGLSSYDDDEDDEDESEEEISESEFFMKRIVARGFGFDNDHDEKGSRRKESSATASKMMMEMKKNQMTRPSDVGGGDDVPDYYKLKKKISNPGEGIGINGNAKRNWMGEQTSSNRNITNLQPQEISTQG